MYFSSLNRSKRTISAPADSAPLAASVSSVSVFQPFLGPALTTTILFPKIQPPAIPLLYFCVPVIFVYHCTLDFFLSSVDLRRKQEKSQLL